VIEDSLGGQVLLWARTVAITKATQDAAIARLRLQDSATRAAAVKMVGCTTLYLNGFRCITMRASYDGFKILDSLIHHAILNEKCFSIVSTEIKHLICCTSTAESLSYKVCARL